MATVVWYKGDIESEQQHNTDEEDEKQSILGNWQLVNESNMVVSKQTLTKQTLKTTMHKKKVTNLFLSFGNRGMEQKQHANQPMNQIF